MEKVEEKEGTRRVKWTAADGLIITSVQRIIMDLKIQERSFEELGAKCLYHCRNCRLVGQVVLQAG